MNVSNAQLRKHEALASLALGMWLRQTRDTTASTAFSHASTTWQFLCNVLQNDTGSIRKVLLQRCVRGVEAWSLQKMLMLEVPEDTNRVLRIQVALCAAFVVDVTNNTTWTLTGVVEWLKPVLIKIRNDAMTYQTQRHIALQQSSARTVDCSEMEPLVVNAFQSSLEKVMARVEHSTNQSDVCDPFAFVELCRGAISSLKTLCTFPDEKPGKRVYGAKRRDVVEAATFKKLFELHSKAIEKDFSSSVCPHATKRALALAYKEIDIRQRDGKLSLPMSDVVATCFSIVSKLKLQEYHNNSVDSDGNQVASVVLGTIFRNECYSIEEILYTFHSTLVQDRSSNESTGNLKMLQAWAFWNLINQSCANSHGSDYAGTVDSSWPTFVATIACFSERMFYSKDFDTALQEWKHLYGILGNSILRRDILSDEVMSLCLGKLNAITLELNRSMPFNRIERQVFSKFLQHTLDTELIYAPSLAHIPKRRMYLYRHIFHDCLEPCHRESWFEGVFTHAVLLMKKRSEWGKERMLRLLQVSHSTNKRQARWFQNTLSKFLDGFEEGHWLGFLWCYYSKRVLKHHLWDDAKAQVKEEEERLFLLNQMESFWSQSMLQQMICEEKRFQQKFQSMVAAFQVYLHHEEAGMMDYMEKMILMTREVVQLKLLENPGGVHRWVVESDTMLNIIRDRRGGAFLYPLPFASDVKSTNRAMRSTNLLIQEFLIGLEEGSVEATQQLMKRIQLLDESNMLFRSLVDSCLRWMHHYTPSTALVSCKTHHQWCRLWNYMICWKMPHSESLCEYVEPMSEELRLYAKEDHLRLSCTEAMARLSLMQLETRFRSYLATARVPNLSQVTQFFMGLLLEQCASVVSIELFVATMKKYREWFLLEMIPNCILDYMHPMKYRHVVDPSDVNPIVFFSSHHVLTELGILKLLPMLPLFLIFLDRMHDDPSWPWQRYLVSFMSKMALSADYQAGPVHWLLLRAVYWAEAFLYVDDSKSVGSCKRRFQRVANEFSLNEKGLLDALARPLNQDFKAVNSNGKDAAELMIYDHKRSTAFQCVVSLDEEGKDVICHTMSSDFAGAMAVDVLVSEPNHGFSVFLGFDAWLKMLSRCYCSKRSGVSMRFQCIKLIQELYIPTRFQGSFSECLCRTFQVLLHEFKRMNDSPGCLLDDVVSQMIHACNEVKDPTWFVKCMSTLMKDASVDEWLESVLSFMRRHLIWTSLSPKWSSQDIIVALRGPLTVCDDHVAAVILPLVFQALGMIHCLEHDRSRRANEFIHSDIAMFLRDVVTEPIRERMSVHGIQSALEKVSFHHFLLRPDAVNELCQFAADWPIHPIKLNVHPVVLEEFKEDDLLSRVYWAKLSNVTATDATAEDSKGFNLPQTSQPSTTMIFQPRIPFTSQLTPSSKPVERDVTATSLFTFENEENEKKNENFGSSQQRKRRKGCDRSQSPSHAHVSFASLLHPKPRSTSHLSSRFQSLTKRSKNLHS